MENLDVKGNFRLHLFVTPRFSEAVWCMSARSGRSIQRRCQTLYPKKSDLCLDTCRKVGKLAKVSIIQLSHGGPAEGKDPSAGQSKSSERLPRIFVSVKKGISEKPFQSIEIQNFQKVQKK